MNHPCGDGMNTTQVKADKGDGLYNWLYNMTGVHHPREGMKSWNLSTKSMIQCLTFFMGTPPNRDSCPWVPAGFCTAASYSVKV